MPALDGERAKLERLRLAPEQKVVARKTIEYLSLEAGAPKVTAAGERTGDPAATDEGYA